MRETLVRQNHAHWDGLPYPELADREVLPSLLKQLNSQEIMVLLGIRRAGKSTLFKLIINALLHQHIDPKSILYVNLEDPAFQFIWPDATQLQEIITEAERLTGIKPSYLFLDEVQSVQAWEHFVKSQYDSNIFKKIFITGSNSSLLQQEYSKLLTGRQLTTLVFPFSMTEIFKLNNINDQLSFHQSAARIKKIVDDMLIYGGFPAVALQEDEEIRYQQLQQYYNDILLKDCVANHEIRDVKTFRQVAYYALTNTACKFNYSNLANALNTSDNTIKQYLYILEDSYLTQELLEFHYSLKKQYKGARKIYAIDNGLLSALSPNFSKNLGKKLENLVFTELLKSNPKQLTFYQKNEKYECDFIVETQKGKRIAIQVCYDLNTHNQIREEKGLEKAMQSLECDQGFIITYQNTRQLNSQHEIIPLANWAFSE